MRNLLALMLALVLMLLCGCSKTPTDRPQRTEKTTVTTVVSIGSDTAGETTVTTIADEVTVTEAPATDTITETTVESMDTTVDEIPSTTLAEIEETTTDAADITTNSKTDATTDTKTEATSKVTTKTTTRITTKTTSTGTTDTTATAGSTATTTAATRVTTTTTKVTTKVPSTVTTKMPSTVTTKTPSTATTAAVVTTEPTPKKTTTKKRKTTTKTTTTTAAPSEERLMLYGPENGTVVDPMTVMLREFLEISDAGEAAEFWIADYYDQDNGASFTITWDYRASSLYQVTWADNAELKNARTMMVAGGSFGITGLPHDSECYFKVTDISNDLESEVRCVYILGGQVRWINAEGCRNVRDIGGWKTESGKTVRYNMLYRGACIDGYNGIELTAFGKKQFREMLGIKTQLDLRGKDDGNEGTQSSSDFGGTYVKATFNQYDYIFTDSYSKQALGKIFDVLSDEANYPIYYHCNAGSDRTGTLTFIINGLLGVSYEDLTRDFELTGFSIGKRLRSALNMDNGDITWAASGVMQAGGNYIAWGPLHDKMMAEYGTGDGKLSSAIENFLKTECGVTQAEIDTVRRLMLE